MTLDLRGMAPLLQVFDMSTSVAFYRDVLGFSVVETSMPRDGDHFDWGLLRRGGIELMLNTAYETPDRPPGPEPGRVAAHGDTALFFGCPDLDQAYAFVRACGIAADPPVVRDYGMRQLAFRDPDGYGICLQWPAA